MSLSPPRPASGSSKRSSTASISQSQSKFDMESSETPPTPSISSIYTGFNLQDELSQSSELNASTSRSGPAIERSASSASLHRSPIPRRRSSSISLPKRRSSRTLKERKSPSDIVGVHSHSPGSTLQASKSAEYAAALLQGSDLVLRTHNRDTEERRTFAAAHLFCLNLIEACHLLLSTIILPVGNAVTAALISLFRDAEVSRPDTQALNTHAETKPIAVTQTDKTFAEHFKYIICTSGLLTSKLAISSYNHEVVLPTDSESEGQEKPEQASPMSTQDNRIATSASSVPSQTSIRLSGSSKTLFDATCWSAVLLALLSRNAQAWSRGTVILISVTWAIIATIGLDESMDLAFEVSHKNIGRYSLQEYDRKAEADSKSAFLSDLESSRLKAKMCTQVFELVSVAKSFDLECNRTIAAIQEVELVSRGFKLTHPLPPISRIEATSLTSPTRSKHDSHILTATAMSNVKLSRSSSSGASAASGRKHHGSRPQSILLTNGRNSPDSRCSDSEADSIRMASLRRLLISLFGSLKEALLEAQNTLHPLIDEKEWSLLREMYEIADSPDNPFAPEPQSAPAAATTFEKRMSWTTMTGARLDDGIISSSEDESIHTFTTPRRFSHSTADPVAVSGGGLAGFSSKHRRDSGMSETWSVSSPSREGATSRGGGGGGSRLGYVSDRTPSTSTPNQNAASKRLSYISPASGASTPLLGVKSLLYQQASSSPVMISRSNSRKRAGGTNFGMMDEQQQRSGSPSMHQSNLGSGRTSGGKTEAYLIASLKRSFEEVHLMRRSVLCHLLALDFTLKRKVALPMRRGGPSMSLTYWNTAGLVMKRLAGTMTQLGAEVKAGLEEDMNEGHLVGIPGHDQSVSDDNHLATPSEQHDPDMSGLEERLMAMGQALRSVQVKVRSCAEEMRLRDPPALHGSRGRGVLTGEDAVPISPTRMHEKSEKILETVREDIMNLSAEWENAMKILRLQPHDSIGDTSASTVNSSRLDSPQEAEEDALRQWTPPRNKGQDHDASENESASNTLLESRGGERGEHIDYLEFLLSSTSPDHLPLPGLEKVYESVGQSGESKTQRSTLSREERIQLAREQRAKASKEAKSHTTSPSTASPFEANNGIIRELQAVMKNRKVVPLVPPRRSAQDEAKSESPFRGQGAPSFPATTDHHHHHPDEEEKQVQGDAFAF
jgi:hypothetical protein